MPPKTEAYFLPFLMPLFPWHVEVSGCMGNIAYHYSENVEIVVAHQNARHYPWHVHRNRWTAGFVLEGEGTLGTHHGMRALHPGEHFVVAPGEAHCLAITERSVFLALCIDASTPVTDVQKALESLLCRIPGIHFSGQVKSRLSMERLEHVFTRKTLNLRPAETPGAKSPAGGSLLQQLMIDPSEPLSVKEMAAAAKNSPWQFIRHFHRITGMTPHAFRLACRLSLVRQLLRQGETAASSAIAAGFVDQSHMHKLFRRHHGLTPRQFLNCSFRIGP